ncbi:MAG: type II TA system antitoxin MqsA family protein [Thermacetogeniaceae bacterium]|jgi:putative zinc finger/helix-turn-helix YgiT family protein
MSDSCKYCYNCDKQVPFNVKEKDVTTTIKGVKIAYKAKVAYCNECDNEIYIPELDDINIRIANKAYRDKAGLVSPSDINKLLEMYDIGKKPLAKLLGWGETTIERYVNGITPLKIYSEMLIKLKDPNYMKQVYESKKDSLTETAKTKIERKLDELLNYKPNTTLNIEDVANYFFSKIDIESGSCITNLKLQKMVFYAQGWFMAFYNAPLFESDLQAWVHGPVSYSIWSKYQDYGYKSISIERTSFDIPIFDSKQIELLDYVYDVYGDYDAKVLERMTHKDRPWKEARKGLKANELSQNIISKESIKRYFKLLRDIFEINDVSDIRKSLSVYSVY